MHKVQKYIPIGLLLAFTSKLLISGTTPSEMGVIFAITALVSLEKYLEKSKQLQEIEEKFSKRIIELERLASTQDELVQIIRTELHIVRDNLGTVKMSQGIRSSRG